MTAGGPILRRIMPAPADGGFRQDDYCLWGSAVVKGGDGGYHMFVTRRFLVMAETGKNVRPTFSGELAGNGSVWNVCIPLKDV